jgi:hypothetical protein
MMFSGRKEEQVSNSIIVRSSNPFYRPTVLGNRVFVPTAPPKVVTYHSREGAPRWNPAFWSKRMAPADRAVLFIGRDSTRGSRTYPKGSEIPLGRLADEVSDFRAVKAKAGGASVISQLGRYVPTSGPKKGQIVREKSVSVTVIREPHESWAKFTRNIKELAQLLVTKYGQWEVYVDFVRRGRTVESRIAFWK